VILSFLRGLGRVATGAAQRLPSGLSSRLAGAGGPLELPDAAAMRETALWMERELATERGYRFAAGAPETLLATCFGVLAHEHLAGLAHLPESRRQALVAHIQGFQRAESGLFRDGQHSDAVICRLHKFTPLYIEWQETYFALHALDALGARATHPLAFVKPFQAPLGRDAWLRTLPFDDFWFSSNYLMFLLFFLLLEEGDQSATAHHILDALDARQDPATGFWGTQQGASLFNGMAGAYHLYGFYEHLGRPIHHQAEAVRSTLRTQERSGLFGALGGGPCEDVDAVDILARLQPGSSDDDQQVRTALEKALAALLRCRGEGGAWRWSAALPGVKASKVRYSGLPTLVADSDAGDIWSAWFRPLAIAVACDRLGKRMEWRPTYRRLPMLGWYQPKAR
jgi:hypothetical protein